jgi:predicted transcriptional regulator
MPVIGLALAPLPRRASVRRTILMREAVREYLTREEARQSFQDEAEEAWRDYKKTGLHVTQAEMESWAASLSARRPKRLPKWHK